MVPSFGIISKDVRTLPEKTFFPTPVIVLTLREFIIYI